MTRVALLRILVLVAAILAIEWLCRIGIINRFTMQPPSEIMRDLYRILVSGKFNGAIAATLLNSAMAFVMSVTVGISVAVIIHRRRLAREALDPLFATYYAIPVIAFYPLLIMLLGVGDAPKIMIAFMLGVIAVIVNTLNGLDRVPPALVKTARVVQMSPSETALRVTLPYAMPYMLTGVKFAVAYSLIGIIGSEFILSSNGIGFEISFAYNNYDNSTMYPLIVLVLVVSITLNMMLAWWEKILLARRGLA
ncbi:MAG TPA: ABC transporter permease [Beijerinckiaceae bacterium]|nr:ABC transporter permease [Beijerinckiaceae bacterium]